MNSNSQILKYLFIAILFIWSAWVFFPGSYSVDSWAMFDQVTKNYSTDWQSPIIVFIWRGLYYLTGFFSSLFIFQLFFYWLFIALLLVAINKKTVTFFIGIFAAIILLFIPQYVMKDGHVAIAWGTAASLFILAHRAGRRRKLIASIGMLFLAYGLFARINMILALLPLIYIFIWLYYGDSRGAFFKNMAAISLCALMFMANQFLNYKVLGAEKTYPQYKLRLLDLAGISIATGHNYMPPCVTFYPGYSYDTIARLYTPATFDDIYWPSAGNASVVSRPDSTLNACVRTSWKNAITGHPLIYLQNRTKGFLNYLRIDKRLKAGEYWDVIVYVNPDNPMNIAPPKNVFLNLLYSIYVPLNYTVVFAPWLWLLLNTAFFVYYMRRYRRDRTRYDLKLLAFIQLSGMLAILSQFPIYQHDRDFRYNFWNVFVLFIGCVYSRQKTSVKI